MAEALKTFREGEDILASETNDNNQYLLSRLSDNAAQVQQYVEGEVATIKSNVSSVQATLQNNIDAVKESLKDSYLLIFPNYKERTPQDFSATHTAEKAGWIDIHTWITQYSTVAKLIINDVVIDLGSGLTNREGGHTITRLYPVSKGDVYKIEGGSGGSLHFIPCLGSTVEGV